MVRAEGRCTAAGGNRAGILLLLGCLSCLTLPVRASEPRIEVRLEPQRVGVEDVARLTVIVWAVERGVRPDVAELDNLQVVRGPFTERLVRWVNGVAETSYRFTYQLRPSQAGMATVGSVSVGEGAGALTAGPLSVEVVAGSLAPSRQERRHPVHSVLTQDEPLGSSPGVREGWVELRHLVDNREPFLGEPVIVSLVIDTNLAAVESYELVAPPSFPGWWAQRIESSAPTTVQVAEEDGTRFFRHYLLSHALIPLRPGELTIAPVEARIGLRGRSIFSPGQRVTRTAEAVMVTVRERPAQPDGFTGGVGQIRYQATLEPQTIAFGESAVLTIEVTGTGNLPLIASPPMWPSCDECDTYPPEELSRLQVDESGIHGSRAWRTTVVPRRWGELSLEPVTVSWFDPRTGGYRRQTVGEMQLTVTSPPAGSAAGGQPASVVEPPEQRASGRVGVVWLGVALLAGLAGGGLLAWFLVRRRPERLPARQRHQTPAERARELQMVLERLVVEAGGATSLPPAVRRQIEQIRAGLEAVRFAPGRADHSCTIAELEHRLLQLMGK